jgi:hypothetical protein
VTRDESLEAALLVQDIVLIVASLLLAHFAHVAIAQALPALKPPVAPGEYAHLLVVFLPIWVLAAERLGIHRVRMLTGPRIELARRVFITQAWGLAAVALILVAAQTSLNRSLIAIFFWVSTAVLLAGNSVQRRWIAHRRGESLVLVIGELADEAMVEIRRGRGRRVEQDRSTRWSCRGHSRRTTCGGCSSSLSSWVSRRWFLSPRGSMAWGSRRPGWRWSVARRIWFISGGGRRFQP